MSRKNLISIAPVNCSTQENKFGFQIPEIKEIMTNKNAKQFIEQSLSSILGSLDIDNINLVKEIMDLASAYQNLSEYESKAHEIFEREKTVEKISAKLNCRAEIIYSQIQKHLCSKTVLDFGCGDGKVAECVSKISKMKVVATDIYKHDNLQSTGIVFLKCEQSSVPTNEKFDNVLLLTVLHHADNPIKTLLEAKRLTKSGGKILVLESVFGVKSSSKLGQLSSEEQKMVNFFFDHLYNRILHFCQHEEGKVVVPYNHNTIDGWKNVFEKCGLKLKSMDDQGLDQPLCPEYHVLFVLEVK